MAQNVSFNKEIQILPKNLRSARCSPYEFFKVLAARKTYLITARARRNKHTARMLASARKDHSIPLMAEIADRFLELSELLKYERTW